MLNAKTQLSSHILNILPSRPQQEQMSMMPLTRRKSCFQFDELE